VPPEPLDTSTRSPGLMSAKACSSSSTNSRTGVTPWMTHGPISPAMMGSRATTNRPGTVSSSGSIAFSAMRFWKVFSGPSSPGGKSGPSMARTW
jgi:hypothetical protein